ncbi:hypothetical protein [Gluconobacter kondonii]|uniref:hypothetical protein n=1 Tax=Gluconobacter kondonii TaxID=941463 RepID=UPI001B8C199F|nr:hypothetical protein [Gluconobacter kondonii]MBS1053446.1 hypothetical protein [Gluconobacter kondonii]
MTPEIHNGGTIKSSPRQDRSVLSPDDEGRREEGKKGRREEGKKGRREVFFK